MRRSGFKRAEYTPPPKAPPTRGRMSVIARLDGAPTPAPKSPRYEDKALLEMARGRSCLIRSPLCNNNVETTVACHGGGVHNGKGMGYKVGDHLTVHGCSDCNHYTDAYGGATADEKRAAFEAGHERQLMRWQEVADSHSETPRFRAAAQRVLDYIGSLV